MNPWEAVEQLRFQYLPTIEAELKAHEAFLACKCDKTKMRWDAAREKKATAYVAYVRSVGSAVKSGVPRPNDE